MSPELMEVVRIGSVTGLLAYCWYRAEQRADKERALNQELTRETVASAVKTEATIASLLAILTGRRADA